MTQRTLQTPSEACENNYLSPVEVEWNSPGASGAYHAPPWRLFFMGAKLSVSVYWVVFINVPMKKTHLGYVYFHYFHGNPLFPYNEKGYMHKFYHIWIFMKNRKIDRKCIKSRNIHYVNSYLFLTIISFLHINISVNKLNFLTTK